MPKPYQKRARELVAGMEPWWRDVGTKRKKPSSDGRTDDECTWDSGVFAAAELARRLTGNDQLCAQIQEICFWARKEAEKEHPDA